MNIDIDALREDLIAYFGAASGYYELAIMDVINLEQASDEEVIKIALNNNFNLQEYIINNNKVR